MVVSLWLSIEYAIKTAGGKMIVSQYQISGNTVSLIVEAP